jgi:hypothetical protein
VPASPVTFPLGPATVSGQHQVTVDVALKQPTRITRDIARLAEKQFFASDVFSGLPGVSGGTVLYELPPTTATDLFAERGFQEVVPGAEHPILTFLRGVPMATRPRKIGGKFPVTREQRARNDSRILQRAMTQAANTLALQLDALGMAVLAGRDHGELADDGGAVVGDRRGHDDDDPVGHERAGGRHHQRAAARRRRGTRPQRLDSIIVNPTQYAALAKLALATGQSVEQMLGAVGITNVIKSRRQTAGTALLFEPGAVGFWANEFPLRGKTWEEQDPEQTWYLWNISSAVAVDDPFAMLQLTGL